MECRYRPAGTEPPSAAAVGELMARHPLASVVVAQEDGSLVAHRVPLLLRDGTLVGHVARSNPLWKVAKSFVVSNPALNH